MSIMIVLAFFTKESVVELVQSLVNKGDFKFFKAHIDSCEEVRGGNNNFLWRVTLKLADSTQETIFVKWAGPYNKRSLERGEPISINQKRICGEYALIRKLAALWGQEYVPEIYYFDPDQYVLIMSDVSRGGELLSTSFERNEIYPELGSIFGRLFGVLHSDTYNSSVECCGSPEYRENMRWLFEKYFSAGIRKFVAPEIVDTFYNEAREVTSSWIWGDPVYRNIFVRPNGGVSMVDFDHAHRYDPACDCGLLLAHWLWMGLKTDNEKLKIESEQFQNDFWDAYKQEFSKRNLGEEIKHIKLRAMRWAGLYMVSRTDGASTSYFAHDHEWEKKIREKGVLLFSQTNL